jgi:nascent polypeptide-associated complex subunit alpha
MIKGHVNERQIKRMMQQMGIKSNDMDGIVQVDFIFKDKKISVKGPQVTVLEIQGTRTYQVVGGEETSENAVTSQGKESDINEDDLNLVMQKTGVDREKAIDALRKNGHKPAEAIIYLMTNR